MRSDKNYYRRKKEPIVSGGEIEARKATRDGERGTRITARIRTRLVKVGQESINRF